MKTMSSNSSNSTDMLDFFQGVYSNTSFTPITFLVFLTGVIIGIFGPVSIIWYERNCDNRFRTVLNQMFARSAWYLLAYTILVYIPEGARFLHGPYGEIYCDFHVFFRNLLWVGILLTLDCIVVLRYVFVFTLKNFAVICDDVLARFFNLAILLIAIWGSFVKRVTPGNLPISYFLCSGKDPNEDGGDGHYLNTPQKYNTGRIIIAMSFLLHFVLVPRVLYYQLVTVRNQQPLQLGTLENEGSNNNSDGAKSTRKRMNTLKSLNNNATILDMATQITFLVSLCLIAIAIINSEHVEPRKMNLDEYKYIPFTIQIYGPFLGFLAIHTILFTRNVAMRQRIWRKVKINFRNNQVGIEE